MLRKGGNKLLIKYSSPADTTLCNTRLIKSDTGEIALI
jgi:hypothetical protein